MQDEMRSQQPSAGGAMGGSAGTSGEAGSGSMASRDVPMKLDPGAGANGRLGQKLHQQQMGPGGLGSMPGAQGGVLDHSTSMSRLFSMGMGQAPSPSALGSQVWRVRLSLWSVVLSKASATTSTPIVAQAACASAGTLIKAITAAHSCKPYNALH